VGRVATAAIGGLVSEPGTLTFSGPARNGGRGSQRGRIHHGESAGARRGSGNMVQSLTGFVGSAQQAESDEGGSGIVP
jgi:hypothetical protein